MTFGSGDQESTVGTGALVHIPGGTTHWFRVGEGGAEVLSITSPSGAAGFFRAISRDSAGDAPDLESLIRIAAAHGATILPPPD